MVMNHEFHYSENAISILGVKEVVEFSENEVVLSLEHSGLKLSGREFKLIEADIDKGLLRARGALISLSYGGNTKESIIKKLFK